MNFTGKNLELVREALELALIEVHNQIATCPDVVAYEDDIEVLEAKQRRFQRLIDRFPQK